jgi:hypothetical protein
MDDATIKEQVHDLFDEIVRNATAVFLTVSTRESRAEQAVATANGTLENPPDALLSLIDPRIEQALARHYRRVAAALEAEVIPGAADTE